MKRIIYPLALSLIINTLSATDASQYQVQRESLTNKAFLEVTKNERSEDPSIRIKAQLQITVFGRKNPTQFYGTSDITDSEQTNILSGIKTAMYGPNLDRVTFDEEASRIVSQILFTNIDRLKAFIVEMAKNGYEKAALAGISKITDHLWQDEHATFQAVDGILKTIIGLYLDLPKSDRTPQDLACSKMLLTHFFGKITTDDLEKYRENLSFLANGFLQIGFTSSSNMLFYFSNTLQILPTPLAMKQHVAILHCAMQDPTIVRDTRNFLQFVADVFFDTNSVKEKTPEEIDATLKEIQDRLAAEEYQRQQRV